MHILSKACHHLYQPATLSSARVALNSPVRTATMLVLFGSKE